MVESIAKPEQGGDLALPPGFRFHPTDEEIITSYLLKKILNPNFVCLAVGEVDLNSCEPRELPGRATMGEKEWYFFVHKDLKYPTGMRANRATKEGYWKATGKDREIFSKEKLSELVGMKKTLVFYTGRAPKGCKTNWVMHEFRLDGKSRDQTVNPKDEWVVCKVFNKKGEAKMGNKPAAAADVEAGEQSAGTTPNVSSVEAGDLDGDFLDYLIDPAYFSNYSGSSAASKTSTNAAPLPYGADYSIPTGGFGVLPNYGLTNTASNAHLAMANSVPTSTTNNGSFSWNDMLAAGVGPAVHGAGRGYNVNLHQDGHQAIMARALGGVVGQKFGVPDKGLMPSSSLTGVPQQNKLGSYDGEYAYGNYDLAAAAAAAAAISGRSPADTKNLGGRIQHF